MKTCDQVVQDLKSASKAFSWAIQEVEGGRHGFKHQHHADLIRDLITRLVALAGDVQSLGHQQDLDAAIVLAAQGYKLREGVWAKAAPWDASITLLLTQWADGWAAEASFLEPTGRLQFAISERRDHVASKRVLLSFGPTRQTRRGWAFSL